MKKNLLSNFQPIFFKSEQLLMTVESHDEEIYRYPLRVLHDLLAHFFDDELFAAAALCLICYPPLILDK